LSSSGWIGVDLDGTIAHYDKWINVTHIGRPIAPMVDRVKQWLREGREVRIFTARMAGPKADRIRFQEALTQWLLAAGLPHLEATNVKDFRMVELWDDRAVQVKFNEGTPIGP
jgi:hypothetical protein